MNDQTLNNKLLASLAVFGELNAQGKNLNEILSQFLIEIIKTKKLYQFSSQEIVTHLNEMFEFQIPDAVVKTLLKKFDFITLSHQKYTVNTMNQLTHTSLSEREIEIDHAHKKIIKDLFNYISAQMKTSIDKDQEKKVSKAFTNYLLDNTVDNGYSDYISAFIITNESNEEFIKQLQTIKEGIILYTGLKYNPNLDLNTVSPWQNQLTIYLNTEVLFHAYGLNGELFKALFDDLYTLIKEINRKKKYIFLKYFKESTKEIDSFFNKAVSIVENKSSLDPSTVAMSKIVNGCDTIQVLGKKHDFFNFLTAMGILEEEDCSGLLNENTYEYNIISKDLIQDQLKDGAIEDIDFYLKLLNYVSLKRKNNESKNFDNIGFILLSENRRVNTIAWSDEIKKMGQVPLATNIQFLTNKFWFRLNKGFGHDVYPTSFKVVTKAQILLSTHNNESISAKFNALQNAGLSKEKATSILITLKDKTKLPEELTSSNMPDVIQMISNQDLEIYASEYEHVQKTIIEKSIENQKLHESLNLTQQINSEVSLQNQQHLKDLLNTKTNHYESLLSIKTLINTQVVEKYKIFRNRVVLGFTAYYAVIFYLLYAYGWDVMEMYVYILGAIPFLISIIYGILKEKKVDLFLFILEKKNQIQHNLIIQYNFKQEELEKLETEILQLKEKINP